MDSQITLRLPRDLARALARRAKERRVPKSQIVREAVAQYLAPAEPHLTREERWERVKHLVGSVELDMDAVMADPIARQIYEHNWR
jgi:predicted transcriptional regulator